MAKIGERPIIELPLSSKDRMELRKRGRIYILPETMTFDHWKETFMDGGPKTGIPYMEYVDEGKVVLHDGND